MRDTHGGKACGAHQHTGDNHRFRAKAIGDGAAKNAQTLLNKLTQAERDPYHYGSPPHLIDKTNRDEREDDEKTSTTNMLSMRRKYLPGFLACETRDISLPGNKR